MRPQARLGDLEITSVGKRPLTQCFASQTFVDNRKAAAVGDNISGVAFAIQGSSTVFIEGRPAHRLGDLNSHRRPCIQGSPNVYTA